MSIQGFATYLSTRKSLAKLPMSLCGAVSALLVSCGSLTQILASESEVGPPLIQIGGGIFNVLRTRYCAQASLEYKWSPVVYQLRPLIGIMANAKQSVYVYGGIGYDIFIGKRFVLTPSFTPGIYFQGHGKNLGCPLEFRSSLEAALVFAGHHRLGVQFYHISNASIGYKNPGEESLVFFLAIPLNR